MKKYRLKSEVLVFYFENLNIIEKVNKVLSEVSELKHSITTYKLSLTDNESVVVIQGEFDGIRFSEYVNKGEYIVLDLNGQSILRSYKEEELNKKYTEI